MMDEWFRNKVEKFILTYIYMNKKSKIKNIILKILQFKNFLSFLLLMS
jgi:hypothetical protein